MMYTHSHRLAPQIVPAVSQARRAAALRGLLLLLMVLLLVFVGLMLATACYDVGAAVLGSILAISFIASNYAR